MNAKQIFSKTMPFNIAKLILGLGTVFISILIFAIFMGIGWLFGEGVTGIMFLLWLGAVGIVRFVIMHYMGYLVKAGHVAVIAEAVTTGQVPSDQVAYGKRMVKERFATSNIYFVVDKLISGAVKQIQNTVDKAGNALDFIPGMNAVTGIAKIFIGISLGYIDECCLGYTFYYKDQNAFKSAADGVAVYGQNWKKLIKDAAMTTVVVICSMIGITLVVFVIIGGIFKILGWSGTVAFFLALLIAWAIKFAFIDSWILVKMMVSYMEVAPTTQITFDLYNKLCGVSSKFKNLFEKGNQEQPSYETVGESKGSEIINYESAKEVPLDKNYPVDVVPIYKEAKIINCSLAPSGSGFVDMVLPAKDYQTAVEYYKEELGLTPESFTSQVMVSETFAGEVKGWNVTVMIGHLKTGNNDPSISITVNNKN